MKLIVVLFCLFSLASSISYVRYHEFPEWNFATDMAIKRRAGQCRFMGNIEDAAPMSDVKYLPKFCG